MAWQELVLHHNEETFNSVGVDFCRASFPALAASLASQGRQLSFLMSQQTACRRGYVGLNLALNRDAEKVGLNGKVGRSTEYRVLSSSPVRNPVRCPRRQAGKGQIRSRVGDDQRTLSWCTVYGFVIHSLFVPRQQLKLCMCPVPIFSMLLKHIGRLSYPS